MKNLRSILFSLTVLLLATAAQAQQTNVKANVPFDFVAGNQAYPAGEYSLKSLSESGIPVLIRNDQETSQGLAITNACTSAKISDTTKLVFHQVAGRYFLHQVWTSGKAEGRQFRISKAEVLLAQSQPKAELVIVAANITH